MLRAGKTHQPNPQGKGGSSTLELLLAGRETSCSRPGPDSWQLLRYELAASLLVLSSRFHFKPVVGGCYHLYHHRGELQLSLISPEEGGEKLFSRFLATCRLQTDYFWSMERISRQGEGLLPTLLPAICLQQDAGSSLDKPAAVAGTQKIGSYQRRLGYYQNILNYALGRSLGRRQKLLLDAGEASTIHVKGLQWSLPPESPAD